MSADKETIKKVLYTQLTTVGFLYLTNVKNYDEIDLLNTVKAFHREIKEEDKK